jgi:hypothetical protein
MKKNNFSHYILIIIHMFSQLDCSLLGDTLLFFKKPPTERNHESYVIKGGASCHYFRLRICNGSRCKRPYGEHYTVSNQGD